ncbi:mitochondrial substrate carrier family protein B-like [Zingiber officinale]|uniref:Mitochondrial substrate carrier family protein B n=1 Tax=Zingiber officinale TaxID=94328 RepID=A0A8J5FH88_ZINOF|nr:mitochondrial substrate carrier family protein B-like [Zingiber officinale]KAG6487306.1 hypothetical protein ZIOFF_055892 [Zingiber officinale]
MQTEARIGVVAVPDGGGSQSSTGSGHCRPEQQRKQVHNQPHVGTVENLLAGGVAGAVSKTCTAPLARLTILFQVQGMHSDVASLSKASIWREASRVVYEEGLRAFWKGNLVTIVHRLPYSSIIFYAYEEYKHLLYSIPALGNHRNNASLDACVKLLGGGLAGLTAASIAYPLDLVKTRLSVQTNTMYYKGISHALYAICRDEGIRGLYKGLGATLLGVGPNIAISYAAYETLRSQWQSERPSDSPVLVSLGSGSLAGIASSTVTFPLDLVRRRMQLEGAAGRSPVYTTGLFGAFRHIMRTEGFWGFYRGILPEYYKVVPGVGIVFMTYEALKSFLSSFNAEH